MSDDTSDLPATNDASLPHLDELTQALQAAGDELILVVTGAGISLASGIPTFRGTDPDAVWHHDVMEKGTIAYFYRDPVAAWSWYLARFDKLMDAQPNPAHLAVSSLERWQHGRGGELLVVTQNIDSLHEAAKTEALVKVHGSVDRLRCPRPGCRHGAPRGSLPRADFDLRPFLADPREEHLPRCPACDAILRQHVLLFDEYYNEHVDYQWERVIDGADRAQVVLFVGTSFSVGVTELVLQASRSRGCPIFLIDPAMAPPAPGVTVISARAEEGLPALCAALGADPV